MTTTEMNKRKKRILNILIPVIIITIAILVSGCEERYGKTVAKPEPQNTPYAIADQTVPSYRPTQFSTREDINWHLRETEGRHVWYVYALNYVGEPMFYIISNVRPTNACSSNTANEHLIELTGYATRHVMEAPSLNGTYNKEGTCNTIFLRDSTTGNLIEISGTTFTLIASKQPMFIETDLYRLGSE